MAACFAFCAALLDITCRLLVCPFFTCWSIFFRSKIINFCHADPCVGSFLIIALPQMLFACKNCYAFFLVRIVLVCHILITGLCIAFHCLGNPPQIPFSNISSKSMSLSSSSLNPSKHSSQPLCFACS